MIASLFRRSNEIRGKGREGERRNECVRLELILCLERFNPSMVHYNVLI
jgi:hypothetical protein